MLDQCSDVEQAIAWLKNYRLPSLSETQVVLADATGNAALISVKDGKIAIKKSSARYLIQTNFNPWHPELSEAPVRPRYQ